LLYLSSFTHPATPILHPLSLHDALPILPEAPFRWTVGDTSLASFDPTSGTLTGKRAGKTTLVVKGPGPGLVVTWQIRVIAAGLKDRKSTRLNSSHRTISYAVFCLKKKKK